jgi:molybdate transport system substrate-binding protein
MNKTPAFPAPKTSLLILFTLLFLVGNAVAGEIRVMTSGGFSAPYDKLIPEYERASLDTVETAYGATMGGAPDSIPMRLERNEPADVVILAASALEELIRQGEVVAGSRVDLVRSSIGMAVRSGASKPDISTVQALTRTLLEAESIAFSASASGNYLSIELFQMLGIADELQEKSMRIQGEKVGAVVARGDAEIGFQQISELLPIEGIDYVGPLPEEVQRVTVFSAGIVAGATNVEGARSLIDYLTSEAALPVITESGLERAASN